MKGNHSSMTNKVPDKKTSCWGLHRSPIKYDYSLPEKKFFAKDIKDIISNSMKVSYRWLKKQLRKEILNHYYSVDNVTRLCHKPKIFQSSSNCLSKFVQRYNLTKNKHSNKKVKKLWESRLRCQGFHSYFRHIIFTTNCYYIDLRTQDASIGLSPITGYNQWRKGHRLLWSAFITLGIQKLDMDLYVFHPGACSEFFCSIKL